MKRKMNFIVMTGVNIAVVGVIFFLDTAWALNSVGQSTLFQNERQQPSRTLFQESGTKRVEGSSGRNVTLAKMNQMMFKETIQRLTAPNAFRAAQPVLPEAFQNPNRREPR